MKRQNRKKLFSLTALLSASSLIADFDVAPFLQFRSQSRDTARKLVGTTSHHVYLDDMESFYGTFNMTAQYDRSFRHNAISEALFGDSLVAVPNANAVLPNNDCNDSRNALIISGENVSPRNNLTDLMAENFLLPRDFKSVLTFKPLVQNFLVDFYLYVGLDEWVKGMYFRIYGPVVSNRITLDAQETNINPGTAAGAYSPGYFSANNVPIAELYPNALSYFSGSPLPTTIPDITFNPLQFAKIIPCKHHTETGFAELRGEFGWNYLHENYHVGVNVQAAAPTGKRPNAHYLFENQIGNGKHWELGIGMSGHWTMWRSEDEEQHFDFVVEADITHLFGAKQHRTFDLKGKPLSRYMLAENLVNNASAANPLSGASNAGVQFGGIYSPVANFSTQDVKVSVGVQGDIVAMLNYTNRGFSWDLGYNYWGISREKIELSDSDCSTAFPNKMWALKGDASIAGQATVDAALVTVFLAATESMATIHAGTNGANTTTNPNIDTPIGATTHDAVAGTDVNVNAFGTTNQINTSTTPLFITTNDLDLEGAEIKGMSSKVFTHFSYTWVDREDWVPYLGIGFNAEFGTHNNNENNSTTVVANNGCDDHGVKFALSQWAILVKGGVSFD